MSVKTDADWLEVHRRHGRDNKIRIWREEPQAGGASKQEDEGVELISRTTSKAAEMPIAANLIASLPKPRLLLELDVNALNYCPFSLLETPGASSSRVPDDDVPPFLLAVPHTLEAAWVDIYEMPAKRRIFEAIGRPALVDKGNRSPIAMAMHLFRHQSTTEGETTYLLGGYEDGSVSLRLLDLTNKTSSLIWSFKEHHESVMALALSSDHSFALSVSADDRIVRYTLFPGAPDLKPPQVHRTQRQGKASIAVRNDGCVAATGGWDGNVRLYDTSNFSPLAVLDYHKDTVQAIAFQSLTPAGPFSDNSDSESDDAHPKHAQADLLACGCRDGRVSIWQLMF